jgi:hypothetical protein
MNEVAGLIEKEKGKKKQKQKRNQKLKQTLNDENKNLAT